MRLRFTTLLLATMFAGCRDRNAVEAAASAAPAAIPRGAVYLGVSSLIPDSGSTIVVTASVGAGDTVSIGSFKVRIAYDAASLEYLGDVDVPGMMRAVNPRESEITVAGASGSGSFDGRLFAMTFRVDRPS